MPAVVDEYGPPRAINALAIVEGSESAVEEIQ